MNIDLCFLPAELAGKDLSRRAIVVFDVLRATSTIAAGLEAGVADIRVFDSLQGAKAPLEFRTNEIHQQRRSQPLVETRVPRGLDALTSIRLWRQCLHVFFPKLEFHVEFEKPTWSQLG